MMQDEVDQQKMFKEYLDADEKEDRSNAISAIMEQKGFKTPDRVTETEVRTYLRSDAAYKDKFRGIIGGGSLLIGTVVTILLGVTFAFSSYAVPGDAIDF